MPSDASIYGMIRPMQQGPGPMDLAAQGLQIRHLMDQGQLSAMQRQQLQQQMDEDAAVKAAFNGMQPGQTIGDILPQVMRASPKTGVQLQKSNTEQQVAAANLEKTNLEARALQAKNLRDMAASVQDDTGLAVLREAATKAYGPQFAGSIPQSVADPAFAQWRQQAVMTADEFIKGVEAQKGRDVTTRGQDLTDARVRSEGAANRAVTTRGQDLTDTRQREANAVSAATAALKQRELEGNLATKDAAQEQAMASYDTAIATLDRLVGKGKPGEKDYIAAHPGLQAAVGASFSKTMLPFVGPTPGSDRAGFMKQLETFKAQTFLPMVQQLKGMGALSDAEGQKLSAAVGALHEDMSEKEFKASVALIKEDLAAAKERASRARSKPAAPGGKIGGVLTQNPDGSFNYGFSQ